MNSFLPNFPIHSDTELSKKCQNIGLTNFQQVAHHIFNLTYRRNSSKENLSLVLTEACGTCSTKHAALAQLAIENNFQDLKLILGIYQMNEANTPGVGHVLQTHQLEYIPEAHVYLKYKNNRIDITRTVESEASAFDVLLLEKEILPEQIGDFKVTLHRDFLNKWKKEQGLAMSLEKLWKIREDCIHGLKKMASKKSL